MEQTLFEKIIDGSLPSYKIYEDEFVYAFLDISPAALGHTLVVPKVVSTSVLDTNSENLAAVFTTAGLLAQHIVKELGATGCNILTNAGEDAGQVVHHLHVHIVPRFANDHIGKNLMTSFYDIDGDKDAFFTDIQNRIKIEKI